MASGPMQAPVQSAKIYRFYLTDGAVAAGGQPALTQSFASDDLFYVSNGVIKCRYEGTIQIATHIIGSTSNNSSNRLWAEIKGGNTNPQLLKYGNYASADNVQIAQVNTSTEIYVKFTEAFTLGGGSTGKSYIFITIL